MYISICDDGRPADQFISFQPSLQHKKAPLSYMNAELVKQALAKVLNPHVLVNLVSRRVRQLNAGGGATSLPLIANTANLRVADIALLEIIEDKIGFDMPEMLELTRPTGTNRRKPQGWKSLVAKGNGPHPLTLPLNPH